MGLEKCDVVRRIVNMTRRAARRTMLRDIFQHFLLKTACKIGFILLEVV